MNKPDTKQTSHSETDRKIIQERAFVSSNQQNVIVSTMIILLLLVQVSLSVLIVRRLNNNEGAISEIDEKVSMFARLQPAEVPAFVEDVSSDDDPWLGTEGAPITIVEFADYECPFCADAAVNIGKLLSEYEGQIQFVYRDFPLQDIHPHAFKAAEAANCAGDQGKYWEMQELLFKNQQNLEDDDLKAFAAQLDLNSEVFGTCMDEDKHAKEIEHDIDDADSYLVHTVPTFFVNGHRVIGSSYEALQQVVISASYQKGGK